MKKYFGTLIEGTSYTRLQTCKYGYYKAKLIDEIIATLQAENAELAKLLTEGCNGFGSVLIQTSDMDGVNDWRKRVKEYLLITNHRSK